MHGRGAAGGTLKGPYSKEEVTNRLGPYWVPIPPFGLDQGAKVRMIDDASLYLQNATVGRSFKLTLGGLDQLAVIAKIWLRAVSEDRKVRIKYPGGSWREGVLREEWTIAEAKKLLGRLLDLSDASISGQVSRKRLTQLWSQRWTRSQDKLGSS